jgi:hypothetical protein
MLALMFDPCFKNMQLFTMYLGQENVVIIAEYDDELLLPLLIGDAKLLTPSSGASF